MNNSASTVVLVGVGEMAGVFAKSLLKAGHTIVPVTRDTDVAELASALPDPLMVLVTVGEGDLDDVLASLPSSWKERTVLIQNELLPRDWERHDIEDPTVAVVWFEKKPGIDTNVVIPTPIAGPHAATLVQAFVDAGIAALEIPDEALVDELIAKNLYILVANIAGLETGGTVRDLWNDHEELARNVGDEVLAIQEYLVGRPIDADSAYAHMLAAFDGDPDHGTTGRSAPKRLARALRHAEAGGIAVPTLERIASNHGVGA